MLELRPNCEFCDVDLPPNATEARICTYECTFCATCVEQILSNVCPNCGGGFSPRPIRPTTTRVSGTGLEQHPASEKRVHTKFSKEHIEKFVKSIHTIHPKNR